ncbi:predicted protein [Uncinocarpus reesii 1704]|uniref:Uncharacterized protein n=1 Tax=Uncinocarpus reesii (strain UAMH 1704) TaxID=336963 RepID=C4JZ75_UNCRE|nr:uncharacterized protein UREG_07476 [Uncinocarpus reesii 1704]EEP82611.1 predicted protein [Uncinocarpus reesii 1704]
MLIPSFRNLCFVIFTAFLVLSDVLLAYDISKKLAPQGPLGVTLDRSVAINFPKENDPKDDTVYRSWLFSTHLKFKDPVSEISDGQLWQIARDAVDEMIKDVEQYGISARSVPNALAVLAWDHEIILSSSQKGGASFTYDYGDSPVLESLRLCQAIWKDDGPFGNDKEHRTGASCAEPMAAHLYYATTGEPLDTKKARVGTWTRRKKGWEQTDPCGTPEKDLWGCNLFVAAEGLTVLSPDKDPEEYDIKTLAGGVTASDQIQLCAVGASEG